MSPWSTEHTLSNTVILSASVTHNVIDLIALTHASDFGRLPPLGAVKTDSPTHTAIKLILLSAPFVDSVSK